ncbi:MAG: AlpA family phage regulatory protein [Hydrogenophaga sp.]|jgi:prophage regulatory protein|nr:AlpA family phage regulatory protein [Hydrogenophaga sp.]
MPWKANDPTNTGEPERYLRRPAVEELVQKKKSALYADIKNGLFPAPVRVGKRSVAWKSSDIATWQAQRQHTGGRHD